MSNTYWSNKYLAGERGYYQTANVFNPFTNKPINQDSLAFKLLSNFSFDKEKNILVPFDKSNFIYNDYLERWISKNYKLKKKDLKPTEEDLKLRKKWFDQAYNQPEKFAKVKPERVNLQMSRNLDLNKNTKAAPEIKSRISNKNLDIMKSFKVNPEVNIKISKRNLDLNKNSKLSSEIKSKVSNKNLDIMKSSKVKPEKLNRFSRLDTMQNGPSEIMLLEAPPIIKSEKKPRKSRKKIELEDISDLTSERAIRVQKRFDDIVKSREFKNILELLLETKNKLYHDVDNKKRIKFTINDAPQNKLSQLFRSFENINSLAKLNNAIKNYNNIFSTFKFENKKVEPFSTAWFYAKDHDQLVEDFGRTIN